MLKQIERVFVGTKRDHIYWSIQSLIYLNLSFYISTMISFACSCVPRERIWNPEIPGTCINENGLIVATSVINIVSDWLILILPLMAISRLRMDRRSKYHIMGVFLIGIM